MNDKVPGVGRANTSCGGFLLDLPEKHLGTWHFPGEYGFKKSIGVLVDFRDDKKRNKWIARDQVDIKINEVPDLFLQGLFPLKHLSDDGYGSSNDRLRYGFV